MALDSSNLKVWCRGTDLSASLQSTALDRTRDEVDTTVFTDTIRNMQATFQRVSVAHSGIYADGPFSIAEVLRQAKDTDEEPVTIAPEGATVGNKAFIVLAHRASIVLPDATSPGEVYKASLRASSRSPIGDGVIAYNGTINSDTQTAAYELGAPARGHRVIATVHLVGIASTPSAVFYLESDTAGFPSATIQATSAAQTARGSVALSAIATNAVPITDTWWRVRWDWTTPGSFTAVIGIGITT
jgi:hypothetical protein